MKHNMGTTDRNIRLVVGIAAIAAGVYFQSWWGAIGLVLIGTALMRFCPPYALLGINSCGVKKESEGDMKQVGH